MVKKTFFKQKLKYIIAIAVISFTSIVGAISVIPASAAPAPVTDPGGGGGDVGTAPPFYRPGKYTASQRAQILSKLYAISSGDCAIGTNGIRASDIGSGKWLGNNAPVGFHVDPNDGKVDCNNENNWFGSLLDEAGYADNYEALARQVFRYDAGGDSYYDGDSAKLISLLGKAFFGTTIPANPPDYITYTILMSNFTAAKACGAQEMTSANQGAGKEKVNIYVVENVDGTNRTTVKTYFYDSGDTGKRINIGHEFTFDNKDDGIVECSTIAAELKKPRYADQAAAYANTSGDNTVINAQTGDPEIDPDACGIEDGALRWIACPITSGLRTFTNFMSGAVSSLLTTPTEQIFDTTHEDSAKAYYSAWGVFRNLGIGLIVIAGLVMVISQIAGMEIFDAYTIRKVLPRLVIAMIGISLSWPILQFVVTFFNDIGLWAHHLILTPFSNMPEAEFNTAGAVVNYLLFAGGGSIAAISIAGLGFAGVLSLLGTIALALLIGLFVLAIRQLIIVIAIIVAPLAIAAYILPGTQKLWNFWRETLLTALMMFPIIMAFLAAGQAMSFVASQGGELQKLIGLIVYFAPYALLPFAFKLAGGLMSTIFSIANDRSKGLFDRGKNFRAETRKRRGDEFATGRRKAPGLVTGAYRRTRLANDGGFSLTPGGRKRYEAATQGLLARTSAEMLKNDDGRASGDDYANYLALQKNMTRSKFLNDYSKNLQEDGVDKTIADRTAAQSLATLETSYGAQIGTSGMRVAAYKARTNSTTAYHSGEQGWEERRKEAHGLIADGLLTATDAAAAIKANKARADGSSASFGDIMDYVDSNRKGHTAKSMLANARKGSSVGEVFGGHKNTVASFAAPTYEAYRASIGSADETKRLAEISGRYNVLQQISPEKAEVWAEEVMRKGSGHFVKDDKGNETELNVQQYLSVARRDPEFQTLSREYEVQTQGAVAAFQAQQAANVAEGRPPGGLPNLGG